MKEQFRRAISLYFNSFLWPTLVFLALGTAFVFTAVLSQWLPLMLLLNAILLGMLLALVGILAASIWNLIKKRWRKGLTNAVLLVFCTVAGVFSVLMLSILFMFGPSDDGFADKLTIPPGLAVTTPSPSLRSARGENDAFQEALLTSLDTPGGNDPTITADISALEELHENHPDLLRRYLAAHPGWRVFERLGDQFATRRWMMGTTWNFELNGAYSGFDLGTTSAASGFQSVTTIGLSGEPWAKGLTDRTTLRAGQTASLDIGRGNNLYESRCLITGDGLLLSLFEQSDAKERRITKAALEHLRQEFQPLAADPSWATARNLLPEESIKTGSVRLELRNSSQPGIYDSSIWINPGEPGRIYLKAFEVTKGTRLSEGRLEAASNEWIGWSDNPDELFFSNTHFTIYEGDWGKPYAARMEVWFVPDSGAKERKLLEEVFKIEGWQR